MIKGRAINDLFGVNFADLESDTLQKILSDFQHGYKDNIIAFVIPMSVTIDFIKTYDGDQKLAMASGSGTAVRSEMFRACRLRLISLSGRLQPVLKIL